MLPKAVLLDPAFVVYPIETCPTAVLLSPPVVWDNARPPTATVYPAPPPPVASSKAL